MTNIYSDEEKVQIAQNEYNTYRVLDLFTINDGQTAIGYVSQVNDKSTGEQSFVITDHYVPAKASKQEREAVKEVTILYRGSTGLDKAFQEPADVYLDWVTNDFEMAHKILASEQGDGPPQLVSAAETLKATMKCYPNAKFSVYGHPLGSMNAQYAVADLSEKESQKIAGGYFFQGPNVYPVLSLGQRNIADKLTKEGKLFNYVDAKDIVPIGYGSRQGTVGLLIPILSKKVDLLSQHMWGGYQYDVFGNVLPDTKGDPDVIGFETNQRLLGLAGLKSKFLARGGGRLSATKEIFLEAAEAKAFTLGYRQTIQTELDDLKKWFQTELTQANESWRQTKADARHFGQHLFETEILTALVEGGATRRKIVLEPVERAQKALALLKGAEKEIDTILSKIDQTIADQVALDKELANYLF